MNIFKKICCKWGLHSFRLKVDYSPMVNGDLPIVSCAWCGDDTQISQFGTPPEFIENQMAKIKDKPK